MDIKQTNRVFGAERLKLSELDQYVPQKPLIQIKLEKVFDIDVE